LFYNNNKEGEKGEGVKSALIIKMFGKKKKQRKWASRRISGGQIGNERKKTFAG